MAAGVSGDSDPPGSLRLGGGGGIAILVLPQGAGALPGQERCGQGGTGRAAGGWEPARASRVGGPALRKLPAKDCGGQPPLALH